MPLPKKLLLGLVLLLWVPFAAAQNTLGELLDAGARKLSAEEFKQEVVQRVLVGPASTSGLRLELMYSSAGGIQGKTVAEQSGGMPAMAITAMSSLDGVWNVDDKGRICTSMVIQRLFLPLRCQSWFKYKEDYFVADSDSDRYVKVLRRSVKQ